MLDYEVGSVDFWVALGKKGKPFPVTIFRQNGTWMHKEHPTKTLTDDETREIDAFVKERIGDMKYLWKNNMTTRLRWELPPSE